MDDKYLAFDFDACDALLSLPDELVGKMVRAFAVYLLDDEEPELTGYERAIYVALKGSVCHG